MIGYETSLAIAKAHREIECANELLEKVNGVLAKDDDSEIRDVFGRRQRGLQLGVPSGSNGHRLLDVSFELAKPIITAHIANMEALIQALTLTAMAEAQMKPDCASPSAEGGIPISDWCWHVGDAESVENEGHYNIDQAMSRNDAIEIGANTVDIGEAFYIIEARTRELRDYDDFQPFVATRGKTKFIVDGDGNAQEAQS